MNNLLTLSGVTRIYGAPPNQVTALHDVDFCVRRGEMVAIMGASGSGKSTLLTIAGGLEAPTSGSVDLNGTDLWGLSPTGLARVRRQHVGFVFQGLNLLSGLTAVENIAAPLELDGQSRGQAAAAAAGLLKSVGLGDRGNAYPEDLSGGERQRVAIARGLVGDRQLIFADEPTGALDSTTGDSIMTLLRNACTETRAVVVVTHDRQVAARADRVVRLRDGQIEQDL